MVRDAFLASQRTTRTMAIMLLHASFVSKFCLVDVHFWFTGDTVRAGSGVGEHRV